MFKKLADEHDLTLSLAIVPGCPWQEGLDNAKLGPETAETCEQGRVGWYDEALPKLNPDVVVLLDRPRDDPKVWGDLVSRRDGQQQPLQRAVPRDHPDTLAKISKVAAKTVVIERLIMPETFDPVDCLAKSSRIGQCSVAVPTEPSPSDGYYAAAARRVVEDPRGEPQRRPLPAAPVCQPMSGKQVVWRDDHHYTASYARRPAGRRLEGPHRRGGVQDRLSASRVWLRRPSSSLDVRRTWSDSEPAGPPAPSKEFA